MLDKRKLIYNGHTIMTALWYSDFPSKAIKENLYAAVKRVNTKELI